jgi:hypothetical protein
LTYMQKIRFLFMGLQIAPTTGDLGFGIRCNFSG